MLEHMLSKIPCGSPSSNSNLQLLIDSFFSLVFWDSTWGYFEKKKNKQKIDRKQTTFRTAWIMYNLRQNEENYILSVSSMTLEY